MDVAKLNIRTMARFWGHLGSFCTRYATSLCVCRRGGGGVNVQSLHFEIPKERVTILRYKLHGATKINIGRTSKNKQTGSAQERLLQGEVT